MFTVNELNGKTPIHRQSNYGNLINWKELEGLINLRPFMSNTRFQCTKDGDISWPNKSWLTDVNTYPPQAIETMLKKGTCYIVDCSRVNSKINNFCKMIEDMTNAPTDAHIYFSQVKESSFGKHSDKSANIIIQQEGKSHIKVWRKNGKQVQDFEMWGGDMVFVPSLCPHEIIPLTNRISISFPIAFGHKDIQEREWVELCTN